MLDEQNKIVKIRKLRAGLIIKEGLGERLDGLIKWDDDDLI